MWIHGSCHCSRIDNLAVRGLKYIRKKTPCCQVFHSSSGYDYCHHLCCYHYGQLVNVSAELNWHKRKAVPSSSRLSDTVIFHQHNSLITQITLRLHWGRRVKEVRKWVSRLKGAPLGGIGAPLGGTRAQCQGLSLGHPPPACSHTSINQGKVSTLNILVSLQKSL